MEYGDQCLNFAVMGGNVREELLIAVRFAVENQAVLGLVGPRPEALCTAEDAELERHVEARELGVGVKFGTRDVVDSEAAAGNQFEYLFDEHLAENTPAVVWRTRLIWRALRHAL